LLAGSGIRYVFIVGIGWEKCTQVWNVAWFHFWGAFMIYFSNKLHDRRSLAQVAEKWRWVLVAIVSLALFWTEVYEFIQLSFLNQPLHLFELVVYAILIIGTGLFLELFVRVNRVYKRMVKILEYKHTLSLDLILSDNLDSLAARLVELPSRITDAHEAYLLMRNPITRKFEAAGHWSREGKGVPKEIWDPAIPCQRCKKPTTGNMDKLHLCLNTDQPAMGNSYSLEIADRNLPATILKFRLGPGSQLLREEEEVFNNVVDEIVIALLANQDRKRLSELQSAQVAMAERRMVSAFVHDRLGQNLGYLHLKLDQLGRNENVTKSEKVQTDLSRLREVANESYEIVRDILRKLQPETVPNLTNLLKEHAARVSRVANFELHFEQTGMMLQLPPETQQVAFYAFHEVLSNVQKHSKASNVNVLVTWSDMFLDISVSDNGVGFIPGDMPKDGHYGLEIMRERIAALKGRVMMNSSAEAGTVVSISLPTY
jgi:signal transduction histidine kinase